MFKLSYLFKTILVLTFVTQIATTPKVMATANTDTKDKIDKIGAEVGHFNWDGLEVIWVKDEKLPLYQVVFYFADGALGDQQNNGGETEALFELLTSGTSKHTREMINDQIDFYGTTFSSNVTHEYSALGISGLAKDVETTSKLFCHIWNQSIFPANEITKYKARRTAELSNLISSPSALAERIFRNLSLSGSAYQKPAGPTLASLKNISKQTLLNRLQFFQQNVKKRVYITGPEKTLAIKDILLNECLWNRSLNESATLIRSTNIENEKRNNIENSPKIYFAAIPNSNQSQIRVGRFLSKQEISDPNLLSVVSGYLGGGLISKLMQELRVKNGLTYSVSAFAIPQRDYGRSGIATATKNETTLQTIEMIKNILSETANGKITDTELSKATNYLAGSYLFSFEDPAQFQNQLVYFDHAERPYQELYQYPISIKKFSTADVAKKIHEIFNWNQQTIVVLGDVSLEKELMSLGKVTRINFHNFL